MDNYKIYNGVEIPVIGFGTWQIPDGKDVYDAVLCALKSGYTHIDTAAAYDNEAGVGKAIKDSKIKREELFITTKLWNQKQGYESTLEAFEVSLKKLGIDYLDLYLIHWPQTWVYKDEYPKRAKDTWAAFEELYKQKKVRAIGVSNFMPHHIETIMEDATILPMVNQIEIHPGYNQNEATKYCQEKNIIVQSWSPLACGRIFDHNSPVNEIAQKHGKTLAQVVLRWHLQKGLLPIPKTVTPSRIKENMEIFDFVLDDSDMQSINNLPESDFSGLTPNNPEPLGAYGG